MSHTDPSLAVIAHEIETNAEPKRHEEYYFDDGSVVFMVERTLFRVHKYLFQRSPVFRKMFIENRELGSADELPLDLPNTSAADFSYLCRFIYSLQCNVDDGCLATFQEWASICELATQFHFTTIRTIALRNLDFLPADTITKILLAKKFEESDWLTELYSQLCCQYLFVTDTEAHRLGIDDVVRLARAREDYWRRPDSTAFGDTAKSELATELIKTYFQINPPVPNLTDVAPTASNSESSLPITPQSPTLKSPKMMRRRQINQSNQSNPPSRHPQYYFDDGTVIFKVERTLFKLHRYLFNRSLLFSDMFALPQGTKEPEGLVDQFPIHLGDVTVEEFVLLCRFMYPNDFVVNFEGSFEEWKVILDISTKFLFENIVSIAKRELRAISGHVLEKIGLARQFGFSDWLPALFVLLCRRDKFLSLEEAEILGPRTVLVLARVRETVPRPKNRLNYRSISEYNVNTVLAELGKTVEDL